MYDLTAALSLWVPRQAGEVRRCTTAIVAVTLVSIVLAPKPPTAPSAGKESARSEARIGV